MHRIRHLALLLLALPALAYAGLAPGELPAGTRWYLHADLAGMRDSEVGRELYGWLDREFFSDLRNDLGVDLGAETDRVTLYSRGEDDAVLAVCGRHSDATRRKVLALAELEAGVEELGAGARRYYRLGATDDAEFDGYFSFAVDGLMLFTSEAATMEDLLAAGGRVQQRPTADDTLLILTAERDLMQAGIRADATAGGSWESQVLKHTREAAFVIADRDGLAAIEVRVVATDPAMAASLGGIVGGLIGLQAMAAGERPALAELLGKTKVSVDEGILAVSALVEPELMVRLLSE